MPLTPDSPRCRESATEHLTTAGAPTPDFYRDRSELVTLNPPGPSRPRSRSRPASRVASPTGSRSTSPHREVSLNVSMQSCAPRSRLVTLHRPTPTSMTPREASFLERSYPSPRLSLPSSSAAGLPAASPFASQRMRSSVRMSPHRGGNVPKSLHRHRTAESLLFTKLNPSHGHRDPPHPFEASPTGMLIRKPEPISWIKYPVAPHRIPPGAPPRIPPGAPGPYAAVDVPFEDINNNPTGFEVPKASKRGKLSLTWSPQKLKGREKSRKCVRFASTWGPKHPGAGAGVGALGEYATINPKKLTSRYVRPAVFRRSNLKE